MPTGSTRSCAAGGCDEVTPLILILIIGATVAWIALPLREPPREDPHAVADELAELEVRHQHLLAAIQDADFELQTGKLSDEDHRALRERLRADAVAVIRRQDEMRPAAAPTRRGSPPASPA